MSKRKFTRLKGNQLPQSACDFLNTVNAGQYGGQWTDAYYEGKDPETATNWFITLNDGGSYKVGAMYMTWFQRNPEQGVVAVANWSTSAMHRTLKALRHSEEPPFDPNYQS